MKGLVLANIDYRRHMTDEGEQLQAGLGAAGWSLAGFGYGDGCTDVPTLLDRHQPSHVFVQDKRDWSTDSVGCFDYAVEFKRYVALADRHELLKAVPVKDAGSLVEYQRDFCRQVGADVAVIYYHEQSVLPLSPWLADYRLVRTYHSIDAALCRTIDVHQPRRRGIVTGAVSSVYPLRQKVVGHAGYIGVEVEPHPGYGNRGCRTHGYLRKLAGYRVHVATASSYGFALRKIIESVAVGCTPVTDLPAYDELPEIDEALVRVRPGATVDEVRGAVERADSEWNIVRATHFAQKACRFYDFHAIGKRLSDRLMGMAA